MKVRSKNLTSVIPNGFILRENHKKIMSTLNKQGDGIINVSLVKVFISCTRSTIWIYLDALTRIGVLKKVSSVKYAKGENFDKVWKALEKGEIVPLKSYRPKY